VIALVLIDLPCYRCQACGSWGKWLNPDGTAPELIPKEQGLHMQSDVPTTGPAGAFYKSLRDAALL
jgi:hypothetical protein